MENKILKDIIKCSKKIKGCKLKSKFLEDNSNSFLKLNTFFSTNRIQTLFIVATYELNSQGQKPELTDLAAYFKCNTLELYMYQDEIDQLFKKGIFEIPAYQTVFTRKRNKYYEISTAIREAILENKPFVYCNKELLQPIDFADRVYRLIEDKEVNDVKDQYLALLKTHENSEFITYLKTLKLTLNDQLLFLYTVSASIDGQTTCPLSKVISGFIEHKIEKANYMKAICNSESILTKMHLLELREPTFFSSQGVTLTSQASKHLEKFNIPIITSENKIIDKLMDPSNIIKRQLFFNDNCNKEQHYITSLLKPRKLNQIKKTLKNEGLPEGICILYYGKSGTGKTEAVYQIAKSTNRSLWKVDLSELKSAYYGESQKLVKALFRDYEELRQTSKHTPILLLNEADAVLNKRMSTQFGTDLTNNAIQNIYLDCLEDFKGILFATTNLQNSLDIAFERRFLYKLYFDRPDTSTQTKIWRSKIKNLKPTFVQKLTQEFDFSGGEIDNITRKFVTSKLLNSSIDLENELLRICKNEKIKSNHSKISIGY